MNYNTKSSLHPPKNDKLGLSILDSDIQSIKKLDQEIKPRHSSLKSWKAQSVDLRVIKVAAFTLVEMSIVLIIIGLIVAGIAKGQDMIRAGKIMSVVSDVQKIKTALFLYDDKYDYLPGDHPNASDYWPSALSGDGDRMVETGFSSIINETLQSWVHLNLSGFLPNNMTGSRNSGDYTPGISTYQSKIDGAGFEIAWGAGVSLSNPVFGKLRGNKIRFGTLDNTGVLRGRAVTPAEAKQIDRKIDDGISSSGYAMGVRDSSNSPFYSKCNDSANFYGYLSAYGSMDYLLSNENTACYMLFWLD